MKQLARLFGVALTVTATVTAGSLGVTVATSSMRSHTGGPFSIWFALVDGSGLGNANNTVVIDQFAFGGGASFGSPSFLLGGVTGSMLTSIEFQDSAVLNAFAEPFLAGALLSFRLRFTEHEDDPFPDRLTMGFLDGAGLPVPSSAPAGNFFLGVDLVPEARIATFGSNASEPLWSGDPLVLSAPTVTVPEPGYCWLALLVCGSLTAIVIRRQRSSG